MNKYTFTLIAIICLNILPLIGNPTLIFHYKTIVLVLAAAFLWLTQPAFSVNEAKSNYKSDKFSIIIILLMSSFSVVISNIEWAYYTNKEKTSILFTVVGFLLLLTGISIRVWSIKTLGKHFTATATVTKNHQLIKTGPYKAIRHPSYLGAFLAIIGSAVFLNVKWGIVMTAVAMSLAYYIRINVEERMLSLYFGEQYKIYKLKTKRLIPFIW